MENTIARFGSQMYANRDVAYRGRPNSVFSPSPGANTSFRAAISKKRAVHGVSRVRNFSPAAVLQPGAMTRGVAPAIRGVAPAVRHVPPG